MLRKFLIGAALFVGCGSFALAQNGIRASSQVTSSIITPGPLSTVTGSVIAICNFPANATPCTNKATTFTDNTLGTPCSTSTQVVLDGTTSCVAATDNRGNWGVWVAAGTYSYTITVSTGQSFGPFWFSAGGTGAGGSGTVGPCGTANALAKFGTSTSVICSSVTDDNTNPTRAPNGLNTASGPVSDEWLVDTGGVLANHLACRSASIAAKVVICPAGATLTVIGVAQATVAAGGIVIIEYAAKANVCSTNNTTINDFLIPSLTTPGCVDDTGSASPPTTKTFTWPAETAVAGGQNVQITNASFDTLLAQAGGGLPSCLQFSLIQETAAGTGATYGCINAPATPSGAVYLPFSKASGVAGSWQANQAGVLPRALASSDSIGITDIAPGIVECSLPLCTVTVPDIGATGFAQNPVFKAINGNGTLTFNRTSTSKFIVNNGNNSSIVTSFSLGGGSYATFQKDADGTDWSVTIPPQSSINAAPSPNVTLTNTNAYTVLNSDNTWAYVFNNTGGGGVNITLPQANTVTSSPFVATRYQVHAACTTCTSTAYAQTAGDTIFVALGYGSATISSISDTAGSTFQLIGNFPNFTAHADSSMSLYRATNVPVSASNTLTVVFSSLQTVDENVMEYTGLTIDKLGTFSSAANTTITGSIGVSNLNEVGLAFLATSGNTCPSPWTQVSGSGAGDGYVNCQLLVNSVPSMSTQANGFSVSGDYGSGIILSDYGIPGVVSFQSGWEFYVENATSPCAAVTVNPQGTSKIDTAALSNLTSFIVPCGMTARFRVEGSGTNYEMFQLTGTDAQPLTATYTNATTSFTSTTLTFPLQVGETKSGSCHLTYQGTATTAAPILQFTGPAAPNTVTANVTETLTSGSSPTFYSASTTGATFAIGLGATAIVTTATDMPMQLDFGIINGTTAGTVTLQAKSNGAGTITFEKGSTCVVY